MTNTLLSQLNKLPSFSLTTARALHSGSEKAINQWIWRNIQNGTIIQLKKGLYITHEYLLRNNTPMYKEYLSGLITYPSYVSTTYVLRKNDALTDVTYGITAVTTKSSRVFSNDVDTFSYQSIKKPLFTGYISADYIGHEYFIATLAKSLFDYLYFRSSSIPIEITPKFNILEELRIRTDDMKEVYWKEFHDYVKLSENNKMEIIFNQICPDASNYI